MRIAADMPDMALQIGHLEGLIGRGFVHETYQPVRGAEPPNVVIPRRHRRRRAVSLNAVRLVVHLPRRWLR